MVAIAPSREALLRRSLGACLCLLLLAAATPALAEDIVDGEFEQGGHDWESDVPADWTVDFPPDGGVTGGHALIESPFNDPTGGVGCISQTFVCGEPDMEGQCTISVTYSLELIDAAPGSGRVEIELDGQTMHTSNGDDIDWTTVSFVVACGEHTLSLCLHTDPANNAWRARFDDARAYCDDAVPADASSWSVIKGLYR